MIASVCYTGCWVHEGHFVWFRNTEEDVVVYEMLEKPVGQDDFITRKVYDIDDAIAYQQKLIDFGYEEYGVLIYD